MNYILNLFNSSLTDHSWIGYLVFFVVSYINVVLQNIKNIYVIKATKRQASTIGMITSAFYVGVVVLITYHGLISFIIVPIAHFLGIYTAKSVCESLERKGKLNKKVGVLFLTLFVMFHISLLRINYFLLQKISNKSRNKFTISR